MANETEYLSIDFERIKIILIYMRHLDLNNSRRIIWQRIAVF